MHKHTHINTHTVPPHPPTDIHLFESHAHILPARDQTCHFKTTSKPESTVAQSRCNLFRQDTPHNNLNNTLSPLLLLSFSPDTAAVDAALILLCLVPVVCLPA